MKLRDKLKFAGSAGILAGASMLGGCFGVVTDKGALFVDARGLANNGYSSQATPAQGIGEAIFAANNYHGDLNGNGPDYADFEGIKTAFGRGEPINVYFFSRRFRGQNITFEVEDWNGGRDSVPMYFPHQNMCMGLSINGNNKAPGNYMIRVRAANGMEVGNTSISLR